MTELAWLTNAWYPVALATNPGRSRPLAMHLLGEPLVLFRDAVDEPQCLADRCPHRSPPLSRGRVIRGQLACTLSRRSEAQPLDSKVEQLDGGFRGTARKTRGARSDAGLRQELAMLRGQQRRLAQGANPWSCPVEADRIALAYRQWRGEAARK